MSFSMSAVHQINAHHLASVGPHADDKIYPGNTIDNQETTVVASDREPLGTISHMLL